MIDLDEKTRELFRALNSAKLDPTYTESAAFRLIRGALAEVASDALAEGKGQEAAALAALDIAHDLEANRERRTRREFWRKVYIAVAPVSLGAAKQADEALAAYDERVKEGRQ